MLFESLSAIAREGFLSNQGYAIPSEKDKSQIEYQTDLGLYLFLFTYHWKVTAPLNSFSPLLYSLKVSFVGRFFASSVQLNKDKSPSESVHETGR